ncbi:hypothetical protein ACJJIK_06035 [Microbulbifer sp. ZKSA006]|uniref:hypothetical protein n=1 Tax=Microbulbifer sp. ZKSA006 TaxID=3243390 RepID=UPI00403A2A1A
MIYNQPPSNFFTRSLTFGAALLLSSVLAVATPQENNDTVSDGPSNSDYRIPLCMVNSTGHKASFIYQNRDRRGLGTAWIHVNGHGFTSFSIKAGEYNCHHSVHVFTAGTVGSPSSHADFLFKVDNESSASDDPIYFEGTSNAPNRLYVGRGSTSFGGKKWEAAVFYGNGPNLLMAGNGDLIVPQQHICIVLGEYPVKEPSKEFCPEVK